MDIFDWLHTIFLEGLVLYLESSTDYSISVKGPRNPSPSFLMSLARACWAVGMVIVFLSMLTIIGRVITSARSPVTMISFGLGTTLIWLLWIKTKIEFFIASWSMADGIQFRLVRSFKLVNSFWILSYDGVTYCFTYQARQINWLYFFHVFHNNYSFRILKYR